MNFVKPDRESVAVSRWYKKTIAECCNPACRRKENLHTHHIRPFKQCGELKAITNFIVLCSSCHYGLGLHHRVNGIKRQGREVMLLTWKFLKELQLFGFTSDNKTNDEFKKEVRKYLADCINEKYTKLTR